MYFHLTNTQVIIVSFALVLIIIFALAAFLDKRRRATATRRDFATDDTPDILRQSSSRDDKDRSSTIYTRYADLSACRLGTAEQRITLRGEKQQALAGD